MHRTILALAVLALIAPSPVAADIHGGSYVHHNGILHYRWSFSDDLTSVTFNLKAVHSGWIGMGISTTGGMTRSDFYVAYMNSNGQAVVTDRFANADNAHSEPIEDVDLGGFNNIYNVSGSSVDGVMSFSFTRLCNTTDAYDIVIQNSDIYMLWAYGAVNPTTGSIQYHSSNRSAVRKNFWPQLSYAYENWVAEWSYDADNVFSFDVMFTGKGWAGIAFSNTGSMDQSDFVIGFVDSANVFQINDYVAITSAGGRGHPDEDEVRGGTNDLVNESGKYFASLNLLHYKFSRKAVTGDDFDSDILNQDMFLLFAYGPVNNNEITLHTDRGSAQLNFWVSPY